MDPLSASDVAVLRKYCNNIKKDVSNAKYRRVRLGNEKFAVLWANPNVQQLLNVAGWTTEAEEGYLVLPVAVAPDVMTMLLAEYPEPQTTLAPTPTPITTTASAPTPTPTPTTTLTKEQIKKQKVIDAERQKVKDQIRVEKDRKRKMREAINNDRQQVATVKSKKSVQNVPTFGGRVTRFADVGVDLNKGGG